MFYERKPPGHPDVCSDGRKRYVGREASMFLLTRRVVDSAEVLRLEVKDSALREGDESPEMN